MPAVSLQRVQKRIVSLLFANRLAPYSGLIPTPASNSRYQSLPELTDAILEFDGVIVQARMNIPGDPFRTTWMAISEDIQNGQLIPPHIGSAGNVEVGILDEDTQEYTYTPARYASSRAEILAMRAHPTLYTDAELWAFTEDGTLYHNGDVGRIWRPQYTKSSVCQAPDVDELAVVAGTLGGLPKDGAVTPEIYSAGASYAQWYIASQIKGDRIALPEVEQIESRLAA